MNTTAVPLIELQAPAKLNLGLEVLGRRDDGYHEIATILLAIDLYDTVQLAASDSIELSCAEPMLAGDDNLALRALHALRDETGFSGGAQLDLVKRIPIASGLGGASSDAAAALRGGRELWRLDIEDEGVFSIAARLGSDVPFFLQGGCAVGRGRGELLTPLPPPADSWFVVVAPRMAIPNKTATLYTRLQADEYSDGARIAAQAARFEAGLHLDPLLLENAFAKLLYSLVPWLADLPGLMRDAGAGAVGISGAGPAHYALIATSDEAELTANQLRERLRDRAQVFTAQPASPRRAWARPL